MHWISTQIKLKPKDYYLTVKFFYIFSICLIILAGCSVKPTQSNYISAISDGDLKTLRELEQSPEYQKNKWPSPIHTAIAEKRYQLIPFFISQQYSIDREDPRTGESPLYFATTLGDLKAVKLLIENGALVNSTNYHGVPILAAAPNNSAYVVNYLINNGADLRAKSPSGKDLISLTKSKPILQQLIAKKITALDKAETELFKNIQIGNILGVRNYISQKLSVNIENSDGWSPLMVAANNGRIDIIKKLLSAGAQINKQESTGWSALHFTVNSSNDPKHDYAAAARLLVESGANANLQTDAGYTPLYLSILNARPKTFTALIEARVDVNKPDNDGWTPLMLATNNNKVEMVKELIQAGAEIDTTTPNGWSALHFTVNYPKRLEHDYSDIATLLINAGANTDIQTEAGYTPLYLSILNARPKTFTTLIKAGVDVNKPDKDGWTPLMRACNENRLSMVKQLILAKPYINQTTSDGWSALHFTVNNPDNPKHDYADIAKLLIDAGINLNQQTDAGYTPLYLSILNNRPKTFSTLLVEGAHVNKSNNNGWTPLMQAADDNRFAMVKQLIQAKANIHLTTPDGWSALHFTVNDPNDPKHDYVDVAYLLINAGAKIDQQTDSGYTPLYLSIANYRPATFTALLASGSDINKADTNGRTPLMKAVDSNHISMAKQLIKTGANLDLQTKAGWTALHFTVNDSNNPMQDYYKLAELLIESGASLNTKTKAGYTPLMIAATNGKYSTAKVLIETGANKNLINTRNHNYTALDYAEQGSHYVIAKLLRN